MSFKSSNSYRPSALFPIKMEEDKSEKKTVNNLLNKTKGLILSNKNYNKFMKKYLLLTQESSFKLPEISNYPILKNGNMIPISRTTFTTTNDKNVIFNALNNSSNKNTKAKEVTNFLDNTNNKNENTAYTAKIMENSDNSNKNNESNDKTVNENFNNNNYFSKNFYALRDKKQLDETEKNIRNLVNRVSDMKLNSNDDIYMNKKDGSFKLKNPTGNNDIDNLSEYTKNHYLTKNKTLMLSLLCDFQFCIKIFDYEKLVKNNFDENSNFFNKETLTDIEEILLKLIERITENSYENLTYELKKSYEVLDGKKIDLKITSILLDFTEIKDYNEKIINEDDEGKKEEKPKKVYFNKRIYIPFSLLPLFYYSSFDSFFIFLSKIISRKKNNKQETEENEESKKEEKEEKFFYEEEKSEEPIEINFDSIRDIIKSFQEFILENKFYEKDFNSEKKIHWIADDKEFLITIKPPKIEFSLDDSSFFIGKNIPKDILIFFILKNFINWDFFILNYLSRFKIFRDSLNERFYKRMRDMNKKKNGYSESSDLKDLRVADFRVDFIHLNLDEKVPELPINNSTMLNFLFTNSLGETFYLKLDSYKINICLNNLKEEEFNNEYNEYKNLDNDNENKTQKNFNFSLNHLVKLEKLKKVYDLRTYLKKMVIIKTKDEKDAKNKDNNNNKEKAENIIIFDLNYFESLDDNYFKFLVKNGNIENEENEEITSVNPMQFELITPRISWFKDNKFLTDEIPNRILRRFKRNKIDDWFFELSKFLGKIIKDLKETNSELNSDRNSNSAMKLKLDLMSKDTTEFKRKGSNNTSNIKIPKLNLSKLNSSSIENKKRK